MEICGNRVEICGNRVEICGNRGNLWQSCGNRNKLTTFMLQTFVANPPIKNDQRIERAQSAQCTLRPLRRVDRRTVT